MTKMTANESNEMSDDDRHENQLRLLKQQVKAIMEEAVTKKFIHEESPHVLRFCGTVEQCLLDGLKTRTPGFLRYNKLANLYAKVGKKLPQVKQLITQIEDAEARLTSSDDSRSFRSSTSTTQLRHNGTTSSSRKYLWVRVAVTSQLLDKIAEYLVTHNSDFYDKSSIMADPVRGKILASLLVGPCCLDYTKVKTHDHYWSDPPADELLMRHKLHSRGAPSSPGKRPALNFSSNRHTSSSSDSTERSSSFRDYVESLHQNSKITLLYGKNNVIVQPEDVGEVPGYLSLHQEANCLMIRWTPNQLMNVAEEKTNASSDRNDSCLNGVTTGEKDEDIRKLRHSNKRRPSVLKKSPSSYWEFAISVDVRDVVYLHCHQKPDSGGTLVLIGQDGVQRPPIHFPKGGHLLSFLSCLETGLLPHGYLDPPLRSQKGKGKTFPRLWRKSQQPDANGAADEPTDFVFRVTSSSDSSNITSKQEQSDFGVPSPVKPFPPTFDLFQPVSTLPALLSGSRYVPSSKTGLKKKLKSRDNSGIARSVVFCKGPSPCGQFADQLVQPACECGRYEGTQAAQKYRPAPAPTCRPGQLSSRNTSRPGTVESFDGYVSHLEMYTWDHNQPRHYNSPSDRNPNKLMQDYSGVSLKTLCDTMRRQIVSRAFYGWLAHCRQLAGVRKHLGALVNKTAFSSDFPTDASVGVNEEVWSKLVQDGRLISFEELSRHIYFGGIRVKHLRPLIWLYMLGHYHPGSSEEERSEVDAKTEARYVEVMKMWMAAEVAVKERGCDVDGHSAKLSSSGLSTSSFEIPRRLLKHQSSCLSDVFIPEPESFSSDSSKKPHVIDSFLHDKFDIIDEALKSHTHSSAERKKAKLHRFKKFSRSEESHVPYSSISTTTSVDAYSSLSLKSVSIDEDFDGLMPLPEESETSADTAEDAVVNGSLCNGARSFDASSLHESVDFEPQLLEDFGLNLNQIEKDVYRCDRNHVYFSQPANLQKLSNVMRCYVWEHMEMGYLQGMCDLAAPLLILLDNESLVYSCFVNLMQRITFRKGNAMDALLSNLRSLIQVLDSELFEHLHKRSDCTHFFFCYRWFLLEFKRELSYDEDVFAVWECIWSAKLCSTEQFGLFFALAMLENYRNIILENDMDFSAIVKFFNEMAERHDATTLLQLAKKLIADVQQMIDK